MHSPRPIFPLTGVNWQFTLLFVRQTKIKLKKPTNPQSSPAAECPFLVGKSYFIRTVTYHLVGRVKSVMGVHLILESASWVADSGRFMQAIKDGRLNEVEPVGDAFINLASYTDAFPWNHPLPVTQQ